MTVDGVLARFPDPKRDGDGWAAKCPAHDDRRASLSIGTGDDGRTLLHCHAGCSVDTILAAAHLSPRDLFPETTAARRKAAIVETYDYTDEAGALLYQVCRFDPKDFRQRRPDGAGGWTWTLGHVRRVLFGLPTLHAQHVAYAAEGERDVLALRALGLVATTNAGGAGKWKADYTAQLTAAGVDSVVILPDNDDPGRQHAAAVAASCQAAGLKVKIVALPNLPPKGDVSDWLDAGHTRDELVAIVKGTPLYGPPADATPASPAPSRAEKVKAKPKQGREVQLDDPEPWADPVDGAALLDTLAATCSRYLALPTYASTALALWVAHAFAFPAWFTSPFLAVTSPTKRCGKTLLLIVLGALVPRRLYASNVTPAVLFRTIEKYNPVLLIDEADTFIRDNDETRGVLNSGHTKTTAVAIRAVGDDHDPRAFSTWCPKAIALIGNLPGTLTDRAIEIRMRRRTAGESVARLRQDRIEGLCHDVRRQAARWAADHLDQLQESDPAVPDALNDRAADCWRPLLAVADVAGGTWPARARDAALALSGTAEDDDAATRLLQDIRGIFADDDEPDVLASSVLVERLVGLEDRPWAEWSKGRPLSPAKLARILAGYGIHPAGNTRIGTKVLKAYRRAAFVEPWDRYVGAPEALQGNKPNENGAESPISNRYTADACSALKRVTNPMNTERCSGVALSEGEKGDEDDDAYYGGA